MTDLGTTTFEDADRQVCWRGVQLPGDGFDGFLNGSVRARLRDEDARAEFESHLRGLASTGFEHASIDSVLSAEIPEERDWAVGEAMAEAYLETRHGIVWPWNTTRDKRTPNASLPGADLVGFCRQSSLVRLVLGEVKSSSDADSPPNVVYGRSGLTHQLDKLAHDLSLLCQLLKWLLPRCKGTPCEDLFNEATRGLLGSGNRDVALFGVLVRDTTPAESDLRSRGEALAEAVTAPTTCELVALYIPCGISELPSKMLEETR